MTNGQVPQQPKIYHIVHVDRLPSIVADGHLWCDAEIERRAPPGTMIGMNSIKARRLHELRLNSHPDLHVGDCVPFYFCPRSVMLYLIYQGNHPELGYRGGQGPILHLEADLHATVESVGPSRCRTQAPAFSRIAAILHASTRSIGVPCRREIGASARKGSRQSFWWSTPFPGVSSNESAFIRPGFIGRQSMSLCRTDTGPESKSERTGITKYEGDDHDRIHLG
jgi:hypothetical protein